MGLRTLSQVWEIKGLKTKKRKYKAVRSCPVKIYGFSTGFIPIQVSKNVVVKKIQIESCPRG